MSGTTPQGPGGPEYIESGGGTPVGHERSGGGGGKRVLLVGAAVVGLAVIGAGVWAASTFLATGDQPAQALPASTLAYASIDLDPSGGQKVEAISMLRKFPAFRDKIGLQADDDVRERIFTEIVESGECEGLDYAADVEPWLGQRAAVAAVDTGEEQPTPVGVVQVTDADAAEQGFTRLVEVCGGDTGGWQIEGDWAVVAETDELAAQVAESTGDGALADDETYQQWMEETGDPGVASFYAAPAAAEFLAESDGLMGMSPMPESGMPDESGVPEEMKQTLKDFEGIAATVRFDDGALEMELAGDAGQAAEAVGSGEVGVEALASLPDDTIAAFGVGFPDGWVDTMAEQVAAGTNGEMTREDLYTEVENQTGLTLPEDLETLGGDSAALALGGGFDPEAMFNSADGSDVEIGLKVQGDPEAIGSVLDKLRESMGAAASVLASETRGDFVGISPNDAYRARLVEDGGLGETDAFVSVVDDADTANAVFFVNFDAGDGWLSTLAGEDPEVKENVEPLSGFGMTAWREDETSHAVVRLTTN